ncbi:MAG: AAA family ATPase [Gemmatimonadetes bacterium]|nr:AAA family ATPase [Gemmatimonadota bacterium]
MKLTRLVLSGFKSFADKVELTFEDGITSIVGPNGCGKSNISDAVRWVLGEQRAKILRGARMEDIIFQGTAKRKPLNLSEVSLHFDNSDETLPISYREVVVTRRLTRAGLSEYLVNQQPVRLRDVQDLLRGTGLGGEGGVVIEAQRIDRLLSDRTEERRALFEEAAGIGLYRDRKTTTERRLEKTLEDLRRLDDLISEIQTQVRSLARQRGKAERHKQLTEERFGIVMTLARRRLAQLDVQMATLNTQEQEISEALPRDRELLSKEEREREERVQARATAEAQRNEIERRLAERRLEVGKLEGDLELASERLKNAVERKARAREERIHADARAAHADREKEEAAAERVAATEAHQSVQTELDLRASDEKATRDRLLAQRERVRVMGDALQEQAETGGSLAVEIEALERDLGDLRAQEADATKRSAETVTHSEEARLKLQAASTELAKRQHTDGQASTELERARHALAGAKEHEAALLLERRSAEDRRAQLSARREAIDALERDRVGLAPGARKLLENQDRFGSGAILGPLSDFLRSSGAGAEVAENMLAEWLHAVVVKDEETVDTVRRWHEEEQPGPLVLLPVTPGPTRDGDPPGDIQLEVAEPAGSWAAALLAGHAQLDDTGTAIRRSNGAVFLPGTEDRSGPLQRRAEIERLGEEVAETESQVARLVREAKNAASALSDAESKLEIAARSSDETRQALHELKATHGDGEREVQRAERERREAVGHATRIKKRIDGRAARLHKAQSELQSLKRGRAQAEAELETQRSLLQHQETDQETARENRVHWQVEEAQVSVREQAAREREERAEKALGEATTEIKSLEREIAEIGEATGGAEEQQAQWTDQMAERKAEVAELATAAQNAQRAVQLADETLQISDQGLQSTRESVQQLSERSHRVELERAEIEGRRNAIVERVEAEWRMPLAELLETAPAVEGDEEDLQQEADLLADRLQAGGPVNPLAAQEHDEEKTRLEFLETQRDDLVEARSSLLKALREIDDTARAMFSETFTAVRDNFQRVFLTLFEGGECDVRLVDESDPLDSEIEIRAAPRGKRTQRIHLLSSGERALVAISLLFAIYLTKPSPFCLLDEVDAPLDDSNVQRFLRLLDEFKTDTQFIVITHNPRTMQTADAVYGVTMQEPGVSSIVGVRLGEHAAIA